jgi:hypothetical protein
MRFRATALLYLRLLGLLWPAGMLAATAAWPGQKVFPPMVSVQSERAAIAAPPADTQGSLRYVAGAGVTAEANVFWQSADKAKVVFHIEVEPEKKGRRW